MNKTGIAILSVLIVTYTYISAQTVKIIDWKYKNDGMTSCPVWLKHMLLNNYTDFIQTHPENDYSNKSLSYVCVCNDTPLTEEMKEAENEKFLQFCENIGSVKYSYDKEFDNQECILEQPLNGNITYEYKGYISTKTFNNDKTVLNISEEGKKLLFSDLTIDVADTFWQKIEYEEDKEIKTKYYLYVVFMCDKAKNDACMKKISNEHSQDKK